MARFELSRKNALEQFGQAEELADVVSYSLKTNEEVGQVLESETDCMFSLHSLRGLEKIGDASRAWYFAQGWDEEEITQAVQEGVRCFVVDNEGDLEVLSNFLEGDDVNISLLLRKRLKEHTLKTGRYFVHGFYSERINELIPELASNPDIEELGIHMHRKTQNVSEWNLERELEETIEDGVLEAIDILNIGGGLPSVYKNYRAENLDHIMEKIKDLREWLNGQKVKMMIEPGRFIAAPSVKLVAEVKRVYDGNVILDCSIYNAAMDTFMEHIRLLVEGESEEEEGEPYTLKGCTPDSRDIFRYRVYFEEEPEVGDEIVFRNAGAYNYHTDFCFLPELETIMVD